MKEVLISSSALILALTALRFLFRKHISRRLQYALWGLVLLRLLLPVSLPEASFSVMSGAARLGERIETAVPAAQAFPQPVAEPPALYFEPVPTREEPAARTAVNWKALWLAGAAAALVWFALVNLRFGRGLRRSRRSFDVPDFPLPVYVSDVPVSPCLFGLFRPAVYLTPDAASQEQRALRHVLTHELCHYRHGDQFWPVLRCLVLSLYWFDPLVWLAAALSRADGEQACDEAAIRLLGEEERLPYGRTLVGMVAVRSAPGLFCAATTMASGKKGLKRRLERIARRPKILVRTVVLTLLAAAALVSCTFTSGKEAPEDSGETPDNCLRFVGTPTELRESLSSYDIYSFQYDLDGSYKGIAAWAEIWQDGEVTGTELLGTEDLSGEPGTLEIGVSEQGKAGSMLYLMFGLQTEKDGVQVFGSLPVSTEGFAARATAWLDSGSDEAYRVTAERPVILLSLAYQSDGNSVLNSYDPEYLMENPKALANYECAVVVKCAFTGGEAEDYRIPEPEEYVQASYSVTLTKGGGEEEEVTGFDEELPHRMVTNAMLTSAAWPPREAIGSRPCVFHIRQTLNRRDGSETHDYYAYRLDSGRAVFQMGSTYYTMLSEDLMAQLERAAGVEPGKIYNLDAAVSGAILDRGGYSARLRTESHHTLLIDESESETVVYCVALDLGFDCVDGRLEEAGGSCSPRALIFARDEDGAYRLSEYWTPEDGEGWAGSIRKKFPARIVADALDSQKYVLAETRSCYAQAIEYFSSEIDLTGEIAERVEILCNTPGWEELSPYVEPGYLDYRQLLYYGDETLGYVFGEFLKGGQTGERGRVLWRLMEALLDGETYDVDAESGQDYFDQWKDHVLRLYGQNGVDYIRDNAPKGFLLLIVMDLLRPETVDAAMFPVIPWGLPVGSSSVPWHRIMQSGGETKTAVFYLEVNANDGNGTIPAPGCKLALYYDAADERCLAGVYETNVEGRCRVKFEAPVKCLEDGFFFKVQPDFTLDGKTYQPGGSGVNELPSSLFDSKAEPTIRFNLFESD